jgi:hypothetical protein
MNQSACRSSASFTKLTCILTQVLEIFSNEKNTILSINVIVFPYECQAWITMVDIKQKDYSKFFIKCVIFRYKILQKLGIFPM